MDLLLFSQLAVSRRQSQDGVVVVMDVSQDKTDQLLECLVFLSKYYAVPNSREALTAGLPLTDGILTPSLFPRAAERAGFTAKAQSMALPTISPLLLPWAPPLPMPTLLKATKLLQPAPRPPAP